MMDPAPLSSERGNRQRAAMAVRGKKGIEKNGEQSPFWRHYLDWLEPNTYNTQYNMQRYRTLLLGPVTTPVGDRHFGSLPKGDSTAPYKQL
jgi:hypothetical protein